MPIVPLLLLNVRSTQQICHFSKPDHGLPSSAYTEPSTDDQYSSIYQYTTGRWLWNEEKQLAVRYVRFNVDALCPIAARSVGPVSCTSITKLVEGNQQSLAFNHEWWERGHCEASELQCWTRWLHHR